MKNRQKDLIASVLVLVVSLTALGWSVVILLAEEYRTVIAWVAVVAVALIAFWINLVRYLIVGQ